MPAYFMDHRFDDWKVPSPAPRGEGTRPAGDGKDPFALPSPTAAGASGCRVWRSGAQREAGRIRVPLSDSFVRVPRPRPAFGAA
jgi:hypothetical protein